mgnify:CR=1 FL=1
MLSLKALFYLSQESTRKLAASIFIQSQCSKVYFNEMHTLAASLRVGFAITAKEPLGPTQTGRDLVFRRDFSVFESELNWP